MNHQMVRTITEALDGAIATWVFSDYCEIMWDAFGMDWASQTADGIADERREVAQAVESLHGNLARLRPPDYDNPLVTNFYGVWYQPFQINLAYSSVMREYERKGKSLTDSPILRVVDFGCGALAVPFGLLLCVLDLLEKGKPVPEIRVEAIDTSIQMIWAGEAIWEIFLQRLEQASLLPTGGLPLSISKIQNIADVEVGTGDEERWFTAFHAFYAKYMPTTTHELSQLRNTVNPSLAIMTGHKGNQHLIEAASPFNKDGGKFVNLPPLLLDSRFDATTSWRQGKANLLDNGNRWKSRLRDSTVGWVRPGYQDTVSYVYRANSLATPPDLPF